MGLSRPLADVGTLLRYAMGESACSVAGPRPELVGRVVPVSVLDPAECGACPDVVLSVGVPPSLRGTVPEVVLAPPATRALFPGFTLQPLWDGALLAFLAGTAPPGLLKALRAFFPWRRRPRGTCRGRAKVPSPGLTILTWAWSLMPTRTTSTSSASRPPPPPPPSRPPPPRGPDLAPGGGGRRLSPRPGTPPAQGWDLRCCAKPRGDPAARTRRATPLRRAMTSPPPCGSAPLRATLHPP